MRREMTTGEAVAVFALALAALACSVMAVVDEIAWAAPMVLCMWLSESLGGGV